MTLNVNLTTSQQSILDAAQSRIMASRRRLQEAQERPRPSLRPRPQFTKIGASSRQWVLPKPGAPLLEEDLRIAHCEFLGPTFNSGGAIWMAVSGDRRAKLAESDTVEDFSLVEYGTFVLPVRGETCILVAYGRLKGQAFTPDTGAAFNQTRLRISRAWLCTFETIRRIPIPSNLQSILNVLNPGPINDFTNSNGAINGVSVSPFPPYVIYEPPEGWIYYSDSAYDPSIFRHLNRISPFTSSAQRFPSSLKQLIQDVRYGIFVGEPARYYSEWLGEHNSDFDIDDPDVQSLIRSIPELTQPLPPDYSDLLQPPSPPFPSGYVLGGGRYDFIAWDWNDPDYCSSMCLALGFSAADLAA